MSPTQEIDAAVERADAARLSVLNSELNRLTQQANYLLSTYFAIISVAVVVIGALVLTLPDYCAAAASCSDSSVQNPWVFFPVPLPPLLLSMFLAFVNINVNLVAQLRNKVEHEIGELGGVSIAPEPHRFEKHSLPIPSANRMASALFSPRPHPSTMAYRQLSLVMVLAVMLSLFFSPAVSVFQLPGNVRAAIVLFYLPPIGLILWTLQRASRPNRGISRDALQAFVDLAEQDERRVAQGAHGTPIRSSVMSRAIIPRFADHLMKIFILPLALLIGEVATPGWELSRQGMWPFLLMVLSFTAIIEILIYQARYLINDLRGLDDDKLHPDRVERGRSDTVTSRAGRTILLTAILVRLILFSYVIIWVLDGRQETIVLLGGILILAAAIPYEWARSKRNEPLVNCQNGASDRVEKFIVGWVGNGYAIRAGIGFLLADSGRHWTLVAGVAATMWLAETANVSLSWNSEASSMISADGQTYHESLSTKPHLAWLVAPLGIRSLDARSVTSPLATSQRSRNLNHLYRASGRRPWTIAGWLSVAMSAAVGVGLASPEAPARNATIAGCVGLAGGLLLLVPSVMLRHFALLVAPAVAMVAVNANSKQWVLAPIVTSAVILLYLLTMDTTYEAYMRQSVTFRQAPGRAAEFITGWIVLLLAGRRSAQVILNGQQTPTQKQGDTKKAICDWGRDTLIVDLDNCLIPFGADLGEASIELARLSKSIPGLKRVLIATNSSRSTDSLLDIKVPDSIKLGVLVRSSKPRGSRVLRALNDLDATPDDVMAVMGDLVITDGLLALRLGVPFWQHELRANALPIWTRVQRVFGSLLIPLVRPKRHHLPAR